MEREKVLKLTQEEIGNLNKPLASKETELIVEDAQDQLKDR